MTVLVIIEQKPDRHGSSYGRDQKITLTYPDRTTADDAVKHIALGMAEWQQIRIMEEVIVTKTEYNCVDIVVKHK